MTTEHVNPPELYESVSYGFSHASVQDGGKTIHCAGQVAWDREYQVVGGNDLAAQTRQTLENLRVVLAAAGATPADIVRLRTYIVDHEPAKLGVVLPEIRVFYAGATPAPNSVIGVAALALPDFLIEIEATAAI
jgi:enamine deaminase RidA (YjgF/YER057c/UK114 family)